MISLVTYQRIWASSSRLLKSNIKYNYFQSFCTANIHNKNVAKIEPILKNQIFLMPKRNIYGIFKGTTKSNLKIKDNIPDHYKLIYRSTMGNYLLYAHIVSSVAAVIVIMIAIYKTDFSKTELDLSEVKLPARERENEVHVYMAVTIAIFVIIQVLISQLPLRIYNFPQQKKYIFVFYGNYPFSLRKVMCKAGDVVPGPKDGFLPWREDRYIIKDTQKLILLERYFRRPADLYIMLGIQRDPDVDE